MASRVPNLQLRAIRTSMDLSQDAFAASLGRFMRGELHRNVSPTGNLVGMWERGEVRPSQVYRVGLMAFTRLPEWDLGLVPPRSGDAVVPRPRRSPAPGHDDEETLRSIITTGMSLSGLTLELRPDVPDRIGSGYVAEVRDTVEAYRAHVYRYGASDMVRRDVASLLDRCAAAMVAAPGHALRTSLLRSIADTAGLAAYVCRDLLLPGLAQQYYLLGLQAARTAQDPSLTRFLLARLASHNVEIGRFKDALACLDVARRADIAEGATPNERSNHLAVEAWACARAGLVERAVRAISQAESEAGHEEDRTAEPWQVRHLSEAELFSLTGMAFTELATRAPQHAGEAIRRLTKALDLRDSEAARNKILDLVSLADAFLMAGDTEEAIRATVQAAEAARTTSSQRARQRLNEVRQRLEGHINMSGFTALLALIPQEPPPA
jgi:tetratricopeptide (TPR) repeat protein/transcriptional regulator with XRE-family HTH domain